VDRDKLTLTVHSFFFFFLSVIQHQTMSRSVKYIHIFNLSSNLAICILNFGVLFVWINLKIRNCFPCKWKWGKGRLLNLHSKIWWFLCSCRNNHMVQIMSLSDLKLTHIYNHQYRTPVHAVTLQSMHWWSRQTWDILWKWRSYWCFKLHKNILSWLWS
jgi:hypothetical protein